MHTALRVDSAIAVAGLLVTLLLVGGGLRPLRRAPAQATTRERAATAPPAS